MQAQFGVGLREAAANLRICPTTLKRACRRHGITRWPRRQLARLHREGSSRSDGSGETLRTEWGGPGGPSSGDQPPAMPTSSGALLRISGVRNTCLYSDSLACRSRDNCLPIVLECLRRQMCMRGDEVC